jgi:DNA-binding CsgD family transcriptional regulator
MASRHQLRELLSLAGDLRESPDVDVLRRLAVKRLGRVIAGEGASFNVIELATQRFWAVPEHADWDALTTVIAAHPSEHPLLPIYVRAGMAAGVRTLSDVATARAFHATALYSDGYRHYGVEDVAILPVPAEEGRRCGYSMTRASRRWSDGERDLLALLQRELAGAESLVGERVRARAVARALHSTGALYGDGVALLGVGGQVLETNDVARRWLADPAARDQLGAWVACRRVGRAPSVIMLAGHGGAIWARHLHGGGSEPDAVLLHRVRQPVAVARDLGLTPREADVLAHAATGLSDVEVARDLAITVRTVGKHLEHIYRKLGVPGRTAAAARLSAAVAGATAASESVGYA